MLFWTWDHDKEKLGCTLPIHEDDSKTMQDYLDQVGIKEKPRKIDIYLRRDYD